MHQDLDKQCHLLRSKFGVTPILIYCRFSAFITWKPNLDIPSILHCAIQKESKSFQLCCTISAGLVGEFHLYFEWRVSGSQILWSALWLFLLLYRVLFFQTISSILRCDGKTDPPAFTHKTLFAVVKDLNLFWILQWRGRDGLLELCLRQMRNVMHYACSNKIRPIENLAYTKE